jgi:hypothetical protein
MRIEEFTNQFKFFAAKVRVKQTNYSQVIDTTVTAKNQEMARRLIKAQYGKTALVSNVREIK